MNYYCHFLFGSTTLVIVDFLAIINPISIIGVALISIYEVLEKTKVLEKIIRKKKINKWIKVIVIIFSIGLIIIGAINGIVENNKKLKYEGISVSPSSRVIPPVYQEFPVFITNNFDYPIYNIELQISVNEGYLDFAKHLLLLPEKRDISNISELPNGIFCMYGYGMKAKRPLVIFNLPEISAKTSEKYLVKIYGNNYQKKSKIDLEIIFHSKDPLPKFSLPIKPDSNGKYSFPETIKMPDGLEIEEDK